MVCARCSRILAKRPIRQQGLPPVAQPWKLAVSGICRFKELLRCPALVQCLPPFAEPWVASVTGSQRARALLCHLAQLCAVATVVRVPLPRCTLLQTTALTSGHCAVQARQATALPSWHGGTQ